ncbi:hypothetical protein BHE74_00046390 [Ensete ventricosum]|nr:hypothetical protein BHE74_00046390 [Ensete ventricosum]
MLHGATTVTIKDTNYAVSTCQRISLWMRATSTCVSIVGFLKSSRQLPPTPPLSGATTAPATNPVRSGALLRPNSSEPKPLMAWQEIIRYS